MRYVNARFEQEDREFAYRIFVTKSLQLIPQQKYLTRNFDDILNKSVLDKRSGDEIAADIITNAGLSFGEQDDDSI